MSERPVIITPVFIRHHNLRCLGRILLSACGAAAVFFLLFVFGWLLVSLISGRKELDGIALGVATIFALGTFGFGHQWLRKHGPQDWERIARKPDRRPGMRLSRMSNQEYGQVGRGLLGLILAGPEWLVKIREEWRGMMPTTGEFAAHMEMLRQHFAARDAWVPMKDFSKYEVELYQLARLNIVAVREMVGQWHFHITLEGTVKRSSEKEAKK